MAEERKDRLVQLRNGMWIDPRSISLVTAIAFAKHGTNARASVHIETRAGEVHRIPCVDFKGAEQLRDSLAAIANHRGRQVKTAAGVDYRGVPMPGDADYQAGQQNGRAGVS